MTRGQLPKAYLRIDPNIDQTHPDNLDGFLRLLCAANRQPTRGTFRSRAVIDSLFGKTATDKLYVRGDLVDQADGTVLVPGWDSWQEGDYTVSERMRRVRIRRNTAVTQPSPEPSPTVTQPVTPAVTSPSPPSEATRQQGNKAVDVSETKGDRASPRPPSPRQQVVAWLTANDYGEPSGWARKPFDEMVRRFGAERMIGLLDEARLMGAQTSTQLVKLTERALEPRNGTKPGKYLEHDGKDLADAFVRD